MSKEFDWSKAHPWMRAAYDFGRLNQGWCAVRSGSEQHKAWVRYFDGLGWRPQTFAASREWTAPCQWPEWLMIDWPK